MSAIAFVASQARRPRKPEPRTTRNMSGISFFRMDDRRRSGGLSPAEVVDRHRDDGQNCCYGDMFGRGAPAAALLRRNPFLLSIVACWRPRVSPRAFDVAALHWKTRKVSKML